MRTWNVFFIFGYDRISKAIFFALMLQVKIILFFPVFLFLEINWKIMTPLIFISGDLDDLDGHSIPSGRLSTDMFGSGQSLDREPSLGQVPVVPPGTPPMDWPHYNGLPTNAAYLGRHSPNIPTSNPHMLPMESMAMLGAHGGPRMLPTDLNDNSPGFHDYPGPPSQNHVEVY